MGPCAPIALFAYSRPDHLRRTLDALRLCLEAKDTDLVVYSDGPKNEKAQAGVDAVRTLLRTVSGFRSVRVVERATNMGLANSIIQGVGEVVAEHGRVIVVEDDLVVSPAFLTYMNRGLELYADEEKVAAIHGYCFAGEQELPETYFLRAVGCWGWATWDRAWAHFRADGAQLLRELEERQLCHAFDIDGDYPYTQMLRDQISGRNNSWAIRWNASVFLKEMLVLNPGRSMCENIGFDGSGENCGSTNIKRPQIAESVPKVEKIDAVELAEVRREFGGRMRSLTIRISSSPQKNTKTQMKSTMKKAIKKSLQKMGFDIIRHRPTAPMVEIPKPEPTLQFPSGTSLADQEILKKAVGFTMTSMARQLALIAAVRYVARRNIPGCFVECGVWRGGSSMIVAMVLAQEGITDRDLYLFDTFEGMPPPTDADKSLDGVSAVTQLAAEAKGEQSTIWCVAGIEDVRANMASVGYPMDRIHLIKGTVEQTIPGQGPPDSIALLRLDTDWYESTKHEMEHLFPRLEKDGALIIDDYGHWQGARKAIDEYFQASPQQYLMHPIDYTGRILIKN